MTKAAMTNLTQAPRSAVDFSDPAFKAAAGVLGGDNMCAFLMAMAAWQRGLRVEFFGNQADARVNVANMARSSDVPRLFKVSEGSVSHFFDFSMGDLTTEKVAVAARSKAKTKERLLAAGVAAPQGILSDGKNSAEVKAFLAASEAEYFVVKPATGSQGDHVMTRLTKAQVLPAIGTRNFNRDVVEEFIRGTEYRVCVVGDRAVNGYIRTGIFVVGNGLDTIGQLIMRKNALRKLNPYLSKNIIEPAEATLYLRRFGQDPTRVPVMGERVVLADVMNVSVGGDCFGLAEDLPPDVAATAVAANRAMGLPASGVDIIRDSKRAYVLELNDRSHIGGLAFPSTGKSGGNAVAEAIIDLYFPARPGAPITRRNVVLDCTALAAEFAKKGKRARYLFAPLEG